MSKYIHFTGIVEDRQDPHKVGRVRVRCLGYHSDSIQTLPTADLPWAQCALPTTAGGISGLGQSPTFLVKGTWVHGFFRDGEQAQQPVVLGVLPGRPTEYSSRYYSKAGYDGSGIYPKYINETDTNRLASSITDNPSLVNLIRTDTEIKDVATADFNSRTNADNSVMAASDGDTWSQPTLAYAAQYPYNKVTETESGHIQEFDDTPAAERIHFRHKVGTSLEWTADGNQINIIKGHSYRMAVGSDKTYIEGDSDFSIDGRHKIFINKSATFNNHYDIQVGANANLNIQVDTGDVNVVTRVGKVNVNAGGDYNLKVGGNYTLSVDGSHSETIAGTRTETVTGDNTKTGKTINLN